MTATLGDDFLFGVTTSAAQVEGADRDDGRTASVWDVFAAAPGTIVDGSTPRTGADHYRKMESDVELLAELRVQAYRFSIAWSRVQPAGSGAANEPGLDFYDRLVDRLLGNGIAPWATLYHWGLPVEVMLAGGWLARDTADRFGHYTRLVADRLGDRVAAWITMSDPAAHTFNGHAVGIDAPGLTLFGGAFAAAHHQLLGHARAVEVLRSTTATGSRIGIANNHAAVNPASDSDEDRQAAGLYDAVHNHQFGDPLLTGRYPEQLAELPGTDLSVVLDGDLAAIAAPLDIYGVNYQHPRLIAAAAGNRSIPFTMADAVEHPTPASGWPIVPSALTRTLTHLHDRYPNLPPVFVTESGAAFTDTDTDTDTDADLERIAYLDDHLAAVGAAREAGVDVRGYFYASLLDGWEWAHGHSQRFGLVRVDADSLERRPRASFRHYAELIAAYRSAASR